jgi:hypothetical protein
MGAVFSPNFQIIDSLSTSCLYLSFVWIYGCSQIIVSLYLLTIKNRNRSQISTRTLRACGTSHRPQRNCKIPVYRNENRCSAFRLGGSQAFENASYAIDSSEPSRLMPPAFNQHRLCQGMYLDNIFISEILVESILV